MIDRDLLEQVKKLLAATRNTSNGGPFSRSQAARAFFLPKTKDRPKAVFTSRCPIGHTYAQTHLNRTGCKHRMDDASSRANPPALPH
ncbi:hypothetical protein D3C76_852980 [compost metagenome]